MSTGILLRPPAPRPRRRPRLAGALATLLSFAGLFAVGLGLAEGGIQAALPSMSAQRGQFTAHAGPPLGRSVPTRITIAAIGVDARIQPVGLDSSGAIAAPAVSQRNMAGWYHLGPAPGQAGAAVIVGHVDNRRGPSVFYRLGRLQPGQRIQVTRADHRVATFRVDAVRTYPKTDVPATVWSDPGRPGLRLVTCGGAWVGGRLGYADNVVVFATLIT